MPYFGPCDSRDQQGYHQGMRRFLPPQQALWLIVDGLLCLMAAGFATMRKFGPPRGHVYAALQR